MKIYNSVTDIMTDRMNNQLSHMNNFSLYETEYKLRNCSIINADRSEYPTKFIECGKICDAIFGIIDNSNIKRVVYETREYYIEAHLTNISFFDNKFDVWSFTNTILPIVPFSRWDIYVETEQPMDYIKVIGIISNNKKSELCPDIPICGRINDSCERWVIRWLSMKEDPERKIKFNIDNTPFYEWKVIDGIMTFII